MAKKAAQVLARSAKMTAEYERSAPEAGMSPSYHICTITGPESYSTGGEANSPAAMDPVVLCPNARFVATPPSDVSGTYRIVYDASTGYFKWFVVATEAEVTAATDLRAITIPYLVIGY